MTDVVLWRLVKFWKDFKANEESKGKLLYKDFQTYEEFEKYEDSFDLVNIPYAVKRWYFGILDDLRATGIISNEKCFLEEEREFYPPSLNLFDDLMDFLEIYKKENPSFEEVTFKVGDQIQKNAKQINAQLGPGSCNWTEEGKILLK